MVRKWKAFLSLALVAVLSFGEVVAVQANPAEATTEEVTVEVAALDETLTEVATEEETGTEATSEVATETTTEETTVVETVVEISTEALTEETSVAAVETEVETVAETETTTEIADEAVPMVMLVQKDNELSYLFSDLTATTTWGAELTANEDGSTKFVFPKQYNQVSFKIPEEVDKTRLEKVVCNTSGDTSYLSVKFYADEGMQTEKAVAYGTNQLAVGDLTAADLVCVGIMGLEEAYEVTLDSITFVLGEKKAEAEDTEEVVADKTYTFAELEKKANWNVEIEEKENGDTTFSFVNQYGAVSYLIPDEVPKDKIDKVVCKIKTSSEHLSLKFFSDEEMQSETKVVYGASQISAEGLAAEDLTCFALMGLQEGYSITIESVTFVMKRPEMKPDVVEKSFYKSAGNNNPIVTQRYSADPGVMVYNDTVYVYATNDIYEYENGKLVENTYGKITTLNCFSSKDLVNWTDHGAIAAAGKDGAAKWANNSWAPCATYKNIDGKDKFFLYFANSGGGIGVLTADSPTGPWTDPLGKALISKNTPNCKDVLWLFDPAVLVDDDGTGYLYFGGGVPAGKEANPATARVVQLGDDMISIVGTPATIEPPYLFEDSGINKIGDKYYYSYCSNWNTSGSKYATAAIEYMVSDNPMGPFTYAGECFKNPGVYFGVWGNNHHSIFEFKGEYYLAYHARALETGKLGTNLGYRSTQIDKMTVKDGVIEDMTPTMEGVAQIGTVNPYETVQAETIARECGIEVVGCGNTYVSATTGDWFGLKGVDFAYGVSEMTLAVKAEKATKIELRTGSPSGTLIGTVEVEAGDSFKEVTTQVTNVSGLRSLYFVCGGDVQVDYWTAKTANVFKFSELVEAMSYDLTTESKENGAIKVDYEKKYAEIRFAIPESVDVTKLNKVVVNLSEGDAKKLAIKLLTSIDPATEAAVAYGSAEVETIGVADLSAIKYIGVMAMDDAVSCTLENIVFELESAADAEEEETGIQIGLKDLEDAITEKTDAEFITGVSIAGNEYADKKIMALVTKHFNAVTLGNELKPDALFGYASKCPAKETTTLNGVTFEVPKLDYSRAERMLNVIVKWNEAHPDEQIKVRGHVLVWHSQTPEWFFHENYDVNEPFVDKEEMTLRQEWFIKTVLEHFTGEGSPYEGLFYGWDVVNEAVSDGRGTYRNENENSNWWRVYQSQEFIINAFRFANKYAPADVELYYNDYNEWFTDKVKGIVQLLTDVKNAEGTRIDGMGMQGHYATAGSPSVDDFKKAARAYAAVVDKVQITELDMSSSSSFDGTSATLDAEYTLQAYRYKAIYDAVLDLRAEGINMSNITIWGVIDKNSWLQTSNSVGGASDGKRPQCPLLFDDNYQVKPAYWAFVDATKLEPQPKSMDITYAVDNVFTAGSKVVLGGGDSRMTAVPVWNEEGISVLVDVKDATVDATDAAIVYVSVNGKVVKAEATRAAATATESGYSMILDIPCDSKVLKINSELFIDFVYIDGANKQAFSDYTLSQDAKDKYFAKATLKPFMMIPNGTVKIDGALDDAWKDAVEVPLTINLGSKTNAAAKLLWDAENLYVYVDVKDAVLNADSANAHEKDSVEVFIDENNHKSGTYEEDDKQYRINYLNEQSFNGTKCVEENVKSQVVMTDDGYAIEMAFAWTDITPKADTAIGLELQINDANASGSRSGTLSWYDATGSGWSNPGVFGTALLVGGAQEPETPQPETPIVPEEPESNENNQKPSISMPSTSKPATNKVVINDVKVPMAESITEATDYAAVTFADEKAVLKLDVLGKYFGRNMYVMAHLGNGIGYTVSNTELGKANEDIALGAKLEKVADFADGFETFRINVLQEKKLSYELGLHVNVGAEYSGSIAYIFSKSLVTGSYEFVQAMPVNEIGNVAVYTNEMTEVMVLIQN